MSMHNYDVFFQRFYCTLSPLIFIYDLLTFVFPCVPIIFVVVVNDIRRACG